MKKISAIFFAFGLLFLVACEANTNVENILSKAEILNKLNNQVVDLTIEKNEELSASAFYISKEYIYTAASAVSNALSIKSNQVKTEQIVSFDLETNSAVLKTNSVNNEYKELEFAKNVSNDQVVYLLQNNTLIEGKVSSINGNSISIQSNTEINHAVVVDSIGNLVGIASLKNGNLEAVLFKSIEINYVNPVQIAVYFDLAETLDINKENYLNYFDVTVNMFDVEVISINQISYKYELVFTSKGNTINSFNYENLLLDLYYDAAITLVDDEQVESLSSSKKSNYFMTSNAHGIIDESTVIVSTYPTNLASVNSLSVVINDISGSILIKK